MLVCLDALMDLVAIYYNVRWCADAQAHLIPFDANLDGLDVIANLCT